MLLQVNSNSNLQILVYQNMNKWTYITFKKTAHILKYIINLKLFSFLKQEEEKEKKTHLTEGRWIPLFASR